MSKNTETEFTLVFFVDDIFTSKDSIKMTTRCPTRKDQQSSTVKSKS